MNAVLKSADDYSALIDAAQARLPGRDIAWLAQQRARGLAHFKDHGLPTRKDEAWRYSQVGKLLEQGFEYHDEAVTALTEPDIEEFMLSDSVAGRLVLANGRWLPELSHLPESSGVRLLGLREALEQEPEMLERGLGRALGEELDAFAALNTALLNDGVLLHLARDTVLEQPLEILHLTVGLDEPALMAPRHLIMLEQGAQATLVEHYAGQASQPYFINSLAEVMLEDGAELRHYRLQDENEQAYHLSSLFLQLAESSRYRGLTTSLGASWSRTEYHAELGRESAACELAGVYMAGDGQLQDFHVDMKHEVPRCGSEQVFKGILFGKGRAVVDGDIRVKPDAQQTDAHFHNDTLLLSRSAEIDAKPQLEIFADDVKCSHGNTVGQIEPEQLFYLRSRGIDAGMARKMLCLGFADTVLETCDVEAYRERVEAKVRTRLDSAALIESDAAA